MLNGAYLVSKNYYHIINEQLSIIRITNASEHIHELSNILALEL